MMIKLCLMLLSLCLPFVSAMAQFDGAVGTDGCKAIHCKDKRIVAWANACKVTRGYQNIAVKENGQVSYGTETDAIGAVSDSNSTDVISLGDGGVAVLQFETSIINGEGYDFVVFENSLNDVFLELAFVEVSSDGIYYVRFPATSNTQADKQVVGFGSIDATLINNLAGKYRVGWGTPFDLSELEGEDRLNLQQIKYVKIIDVVGCIDTAYARYDTGGNIINDPYPTDFPSGGFDLAGVGVLNNKYTNVKEYTVSSFQVYPNPCKDRINISGDGEAEVLIYNSMGQVLVRTQKNDAVCRLDLHLFPAGVYVVLLQSHRQKEYLKIVKY